RREWEGLGRLMVRLIGSEHVEVRAVAEAHLAPLGFERLWNGWEGMTREQRERVGMALMKIDRRFLEKLDGKMAAGESGERVRGIQVVRHLGQETYFESRLVGLSEDGDERVAATAVRALGGMGASAAAEAALGRALSHRDDRVRSNAIEGLEALKRLGEHGEALERISRGDGHRSRATAIRALLSMPLSEGLPALVRMLDEGDERHRISALWVVERMELVGVLDRVATLAKGDGDSRVRSRAVRVIRDMVERARSTQREVG
ncbi:MAG: HEAT repeat domain-containing protein, partial [Desulfobacterales bacterium]|nr:HEAT repeat domain-containing protein [Desulfobacterales bacterium]